MISLPVSIANQINDYWFGEAREHMEFVEQQFAIWFQSNPTVDYEIERCFGKLLDMQSQGEMGDINGDEVVLALIILFDQFSRNIFRGTAKAFQNDEKALALTHRVIESGRLEQYHPLEQVFIFMPLEHAEDLETQQLSLYHFEQLLLQHQDSQWTEFLKNTLVYAQQHFDVIHQFGRYPHRNEVLQRKSTQAEIDYLKQGARFGQ